MRTLVYIAPGDAFEIADGFRENGMRFDLVNLSNIGDYSGLLACLLWCVPLLRTPMAVLQVQTMLGTHQTPDEWVQRQTGGSFTADEVDKMLGLESQVIRQHGAMEIEYRNVSQALELWEQGTVPMVREKLLALFGWISDGQQMPMGRMMDGLMQGRCLGSTCTGTFVKLLHTLCAEAGAHGAPALKGLLDRLIGNDGNGVDRTAPMPRRCVALLAVVAHTLTKHGGTSLSPAIDPTFAEMMDPVVTLRCVVSPFSNKVENFVLAGSKEPMLLAVLTKGKTLNGKAVSRLQGAQLVEAMKTADADCTQLVDTLIFNQFTRVLTMAVPRSLLIDSGSDQWQVQLLDMIDWRWATNPVVLSSTTFAAGAIEEVTEVATGASEPTLAEMMTGAAEAMPRDDAMDNDGDGPRCEVCRCSAQQAATKAAERGTAVSEHFEGGLREGYYCGCYEKLVEDIKIKKAAQAEREKAKAEAAVRFLLLFYCFSIPFPLILVEHIATEAEGVAVWGGRGWGGGGGIERHPKSIAEGPGVSDRGCAERCCFERHGWRGLWAQAERSHQGED